MNGSTSPCVPTIKIAIVSDGSGISTPPSSKEVDDCPRTGKWSAAVHQVAAVRHYMGIHGLVKDFPALPQRKCHCEG